MVGITRKTLNLQFGVLKNENWKYISLKPRLLWKIIKCKYTWNFKRIKFSSNGIILGGKWTVNKASKSARLSNQQVSLLHVTKNAI